MDRERHGKFPKSENRGNNTGLYDIAVFGLHDLVDMRLPLDHKHHSHFLWPPVLPQRFVFSKHMIKDFLWGTYYKLSISSGAGVACCLSRHMLLDVLLHTIRCLCPQVVIVLSNTLLDSMSII